MVAYRRRLLCLAVAFAMALSGATAIAAPSTGTQLQTVQEQASAARAKMERMRGDLDSGIAAYEEASDKLAATRAKIAENGKRLEKLDQSIKDGQERLAGRAEYQYRIGTPGMIDVLFGASSFEDFSARLFVFSEIAKQDDELLTSIKSERAEAIALRAELKEREKAQVAERDEVASRRASVQKQVDAQEAYLDSLSAEVSALVAAEDRAKAAAQVTSKASSTPIRAPKPTKAPISKAGAIVMATVEGRSGKYAVLSGDPMNYRPTGVKFSGVTTMYGNDDNGTGTASGRRFDENEFTCAHKTLPFGTRLAVSKGGKSVIVTVTDRGPYTPGRMLDLTRRSARYLGVDGVGKVTVEIVQPVR